MNRSEEERIIEQMADNIMGRVTIEKIVRIDINSKTNKK